MENKSIYEQYKQAMLNYYKRMQRDGYKGNNAYTPMIEKDERKLRIRTNSSPDRLNPQGIDFEYDSKTKELSICIGEMGRKFDKETGQEMIQEMLFLRYHPDTTMDVIHRSEGNLSPQERLDEYDERLSSATVQYAKRVDSVSMDELFNMSEILDEMDVASSDFFEKLHNRCKFQVPEFDIEAHKEKEIEEDEVTL